MNVLLVSEIMNIFYFQLGSVMALQFGAINALISAGYTIVVAGILGTFIAYLSAKTGMNVNLLSRGGGFGYIGASLTSLIYQKQARKLPLQAREGQSPAVSGR